MNEEQPNHQVTHNCGKGRSVTVTKMSKTLFLCFLHILEENGDPLYFLSSIPLSGHVPKWRSPDLVVVIVLPLQGLYVCRSIKVKIHMRNYLTREFHVELYFFKIKSTVSPEGGKFETVSPD